MGLWHPPIEYGNCAAPFEIVFWDQFGNEYPADGRLSVLRSQQREKTSVWRGTGLDGLEATQKPREPSLTEESQRRYYELLKKTDRNEPTDSVNGVCSRYSSGARTQYGIVRCGYADCLGTDECSRLPALDAGRVNSPDRHCFLVGSLSSDYQWRTRPTSTCTKSELR
jgi:hypothetical protein